MKFCSCGFVSKQQVINPDSYGCEFCCWVMGPCVYQQQVGSSLNSVAWSVLGYMSQHHTPLPHCKLPGSGSLVKRIQSQNNPINPMANIKGTKTGTIV
jgi:hypothetical protein